MFKEDWGVCETLKKNEIQKIIDEKKKAEEDRKNEIQRKIMENERLENERIKKEKEGKKNETDSLNIFFLTLQHIASSKEDEIH